MAWPVVAAPTRQIFGHEIVGRHHDPFTVMYQMAGSGPPAPYIQPVTDWTGWLLARVLDPVAAYNVLVLSTRPLTAAVTYVLARYLRMPHVAALVAAIVFAFAPMHLAHAAYHPHIAQTQWFPLYLLAMFAMVDRPSIPRAIGLAAAGASLVLSSFYAGFIGAVVTPVALLAYWWASPRGPRRLTSLWITAGWIAGLAACAIALVAVLYPQVLRDPSAFGFRVVEVPLYSARWWAYFTPPVSHVVLGPAAADVFTRAGVTFARLEQQVYIGYALLALASVAGVAAAIGWRSAPERRTVLMLLAVAATAVLVSLGPLSGACAADSWVPACRLHAIAPMFRAYARFAVVAHLALAIAAGAGFVLLARRSRMGRIVATGLMVIAIFEYWPLPAQARDVLPTEGHRWLANGPPSQRSIDCVAMEPALTQVPWLMRQHVAFLGSAVPTCRDPYIGPRLAALGYTHLLIRQPDRAGAAPMLDAPDAGVALVAAFPDSRVYQVTAPVPSIAAVADEGFFVYEDAGALVWRWMGEWGRWRVRNTTGKTQRIALSLELESAGWPRRIDVSLDGRSAGSLHVGAAIESHVLGPWSLAPGDHELVFTATGEPFRPSSHGSSSDDRDLTVAFWRHAWMEMDDSSNDRTR